MRDGNLLALQPKDYVATADSKEAPRVYLIETVPPKGAVAMSGIFITDSLMHVQTSFTVSGRF